MHPLTERGKLGPKPDRGDGLPHFSLKEPRYAYASLLVLLGVRPVP